MVRSEWSLLVVLSLVILIVGVGALGFLLMRYRDKLLSNFSQKIWMTVFLGFSFSSLFLLGNGVLAYWFSRSVVVENFALYVAHPWVLIRIGLTCFILNAVLILAFRSMIKTLYQLKR